MNTADEIMGMICTEAIEAHCASQQRAGSASEEELRAEKWRWFEISAARRAHTSRGDYLMNCAVERREVAAARGWRWEHEIKQALRCEHAAREHYQRAADIRAHERRTQNH